jgi:hypothetical protein
VAACLAGVALVPLGWPGVAGAADGTAGKTAGMYIAPGPPHNAPSEIARIRRTGVNTGAIAVWWEINGQNDTEMYPGRFAPSDEALRATIAGIRAQGMSVALFPGLICNGCPGQWRGNLKPSDPDEFFANYRNFIMKYAVIAAETGVTLFSVGSEMKSLEGAPYTQKWYDIISSVRGVFSGSVIYTVNWDSLTRPQFWDRLDYVGVSAFMPLTGVEHPTVGDFKAGWKSSPVWGGERWFDDLKALHQRTGKPVLFGEAGYISSTYSGLRPYDDANVHDPDQDAQANAYQALLETFEPEAWWAGVLWWHWMVTDSPTDRTPRGKKAEQLLTRWYAEGWRPPPDAPAPTTPNAPRAPANPKGRSATGPAPVAPKLRTAAVPPTQAPTTAAPTTTAAPVVAAPTSAPPDDPLAGFEERMERQQAFYRAQAAADARFRRASALAGFLVVGVFFANLAYITSPRRRPVAGPVRPAPRW